MGCDIHSHVEIKCNGEWKHMEAQFSQVFDFDTEPNMEPFSARNYGVFSFLGCTGRNYGRITPLATAKGFPKDASKEVKKEKRNWGSDGHTHSWLTLQELLSIDYDQIIEDRRCTKQLGPKYWSGAETCEVGEGKKMPLREYLGLGFFIDLEILKALGLPHLVRVVFWFDN